jgi:hypothetical protein
MSNFLAIATVTAALRQVLLGPVKSVLNGADVQFNRPDGTGIGTQTPLVNVYLYQVTPNAAYRNADIPTRRSDGSLVRRPQVALDLHYLFTFYGDDAQLEPQRLLGVVASTLQDQPLLSTSNIQAAVLHSTFLTGSGLDSQIERVKFTPTALSLEEFSKLWSAFFQVEYSLSAAYQASVVLIESDESPQEAPPVMGRNLYVVPFRWPQVDQIISQAGADLPIVSTSTILIQGEQLRGDVTLVLIEDQELVPTIITDTQLTLPLPGTLHAGVKGLQVLQKFNMGTPQAPHRGFASNVAPFVLRPTLTGATAVIASNPPKVTNVTLNLAPNIGQGQRAILILSDLSVAPATAYTSTQAVSQADSSQVTVTMNNVPAGNYLARVQIDGAESLLTYVGNNFTGPMVTMP